MTKEVVSMGTGTKCIGQTKMRKSGKQRGALNSDAVLQVSMLTFSPLVKDTGTHWFQDSQGFQKKPCLNKKVSELVVHVFKPSIWETRDWWISLEF